MEKLVAYKRMPLWTKETMPEAVQQKHNTKVGTWGKITVLKGTLKFIELTENGEVWLSNVHIAPYEEGNIWNQEPERRRKLLLHKKQIQKLEQETKGTGMTLVPLKVYIKDGYAKLLLGLAKGKHDYDKRESIKRREQNRDIARVMKAVNQR